MGELMRKRILFILSTLALLMHPLSLSAQNSTAGDHVLTPDFDGNGQVDFPDFLAFAGQFGAREGDGRYDASYDLDRDGEIGISDFLIFSSSFGKSGNEVARIVIPDANLRAIIEDLLDQSSGEPIARSKMARLMRIEARNANIRDLTGLEFATSLTSLDFGTKRVGNKWVNSNEISDLSSLSGLTSLKSLYLTSNSISDVSALSGLIELEWLSLSDNSISDVSALSGLTNLTQLYLSSNNISDVSGLSGLTNLEWLWLRNNSISDVSALSGLIGLEELSLRNNSISDLKPLSGLTNLTYLAVYRNSSISDLSPLSGLTRLERLIFYANSISDLSPLVVNTGLSTGDLVDVRGNPLSTISYRTHIPALQERGVVVRSESTWRPDN
jgi:Ca2+-binding EF-hand superfamily protein